MPTLSPPPRLFQEAVEEEVHRQAVVATTGGLREAGNLARLVRWTSEMTHERDALAGRILQTVATSGEARFRKSVSGQAREALSELGFRGDVVSLQSSKGAIHARYDLTLDARKVLTALPAQDVGHWRLCSPAKTLRLLSRRDGGTALHSGHLRLDDKVPISGLTLTTKTALAHHQIAPINPAAMTPFASANDAADAVIKRRSLMASIRAVEQRAKPLRQQIRSFLLKNGTVDDLTVRHPDTEWVLVARPNIHVDGSSIVDVMRNEVAEACGTEREANVRKAWKNLIFEPVPELVCQRHPCWHNLIFPRAETRLVLMPTPKKFGHATPSA